jgi:hypothetical protein
VVRAYGGKKTSEQNRSIGLRSPFLSVEIFGWLPMLAALAMAMSSVTVVGNSILLGRHKPRLANKKPKNETIYPPGVLEEAYSLQQTS